MSITKFWIYDATGRLRGAHQERTTLPSLNRRLARHGWSATTVSGARR